MKLSGACVNTIVASVATQILSGSASGLHIDIHAHQYVFTRDLPLGACDGELVTCESTLR